MPGASRRRLSSRSTPTQPPQHQVNAAAPPAARRKLRAAAPLPSSKPTASAHLVHGRGTSTCHARRMRPVSARNGSQHARGGTRLQCRRSRLAAVLVGLRRHWRRRQTVLEKCAYGTVRSSILSDRGNGSLRLRLSEAGARRGRRAGGVEKVSGPTWGMLTRWNALGGESYRQCNVSARKKARFRWQP